MSEGTMWLIGLVWVLVVWPLWARHCDKRDRRERLVAEEARAAQVKERYERRLEVQRGRKTAA